VFAFLTWLLPSRELSFIDYHNHELAGRTIFIHGTIIPYWKDAVGLGSFVCHTKSKKNGLKSRPSCHGGTLHWQEKVVEHDGCKRWFEQWSKSKKTDGNGNQVANDKPFINEKKPLSTSAVKGVLNHGEHTLIPVTVKMMHSAVRDCKQFVLKDGRPLHMVKLVGAVRNFCVYFKHVQIDLEDGSGLVWIIFRQKQKECTAQRHLIEDKCNGNCYIRVIGEIEYYYGVHEIIAFDIRPVSSGNKVTHHFLEVAYSYEKRLEIVEDEMMKSVLLV
jgi:hypothetical protein